MVIMHFCDDQSCSWVQELAVVLPLSRHHYSAVPHVYLWEHFHFQNLSLGILLLLKFVSAMRGTRDATPDWILLWFHSSYNFCYTKIKENPRPLLIQNFTIQAVNFTWNFWSWSICCLALALQNIVRTM